MNLAIVFHDLITYVGIEVDVDVVLFQAKGEMLGRLSNNVRVEDGKWGWLIKVGDIQSMAYAIRDAILNPMPSPILEERAKFFRLINLLMIITIFSHV